MGSKDNFSVDLVISSLKYKHWTNLWYFKFLEDIEPFLQRIYYIVTQYMKEFKADSGRATVQHGGAREGRDFPLAHPCILCRTTT